MLISRENILSAFKERHILGDISFWLQFFEGQDLIPFVDSRIVQKQGLFVALQGERVDGHQYLSQAIDNGAIALLIDKNKIDLYERLEQATKEKVICFLTEDPLFSLTCAAKWWRSQLTMPVIGITGSMGKTSTKELMGHIFRANNKVISLTSGNQNSLIGLSISILKTKTTDQYAIFEMGINEVGEMDQLVELAQPTSAVLTGLAHAHTEGLRSFEQVVLEKEKIFSWLKSDQKAIVHQKYLPFLTKHQNHQWFVVGTDKTSDLWFEKKGVEKEGEAQFCFGIMHYKKESVLFRFNEVAPGRLEHILLAFAAAIQQGISLQDASAAVDSFLFVSGRFEKKRIPGGKGFIIDDACNANPETMIAALTFFDSLETDLKKIIVLGEMRELGAYEIEGHRRVLERIASLKNIDQIILIGPLFKMLQKESMFQAELFYFGSREEAFEFLLQSENILNASILLKSSKSVGLSLFIPYFLERKTQFESKNIFQL